MATITKIINKDNSLSYNVKIRRKNCQISQTFRTEEDAKLYEFFKERLIDNMESFDIPLHKRVTLKQIFELKINTLNSLIKRSIAEFENPLKMFQDFFKEKLFIHEITLDDWTNAAKSFYQLNVFRGAKTDSGKRKMSPNSLRKIFASASSCFSYSQSLGIELDNFPLKVIQTYITPLIKKGK